MKFNEKKRPKASVGVMIWKDKKVLLGKRKGSHGAGEYSFTGGHIENGESFDYSARRETLEEVGIKIKNIKFLCVANINKYENRQDIVVGLIADWESGEVRTCEPNKNEGWNWYSLDNLPSPLFYPTKILLDSYKNGKNYYDKSPSQS